ncbi:hypothetical protein [Halospeciosus flavus]|uniref:Uncharacterized protein n=1 Tax=Halospeciosus flavus TaxID=3032283 RepID=A0ABD5YX68_9EURY|nr:hypothetical protein [Halospeciosus flavus]
MATPITDRIKAIRSEVGEENLRVIAEYDKSGYEFQYLSEEVDARYSKAEFDEVFDDLLFDTMRSDVMERRFHGGDYQCSVLSFEEMFVFQFVRDEFDGLVVSIERDCTINLESFIETCAEHT